MVALLDNFDYAPPRQRLPRLRREIARAPARLFAAQPRINLLPIEILQPQLDAEGNETGVLKGADNLKVAQWEHAWRTDATPYGELVDGFIDLDPDRFYVRIPALGNSENMKVKVSTVNAGGATIDGWEEIEMEPDPDDSGYLKSKSQLLVADDPDKNAVGASDSEEIAKRMHKISLFGKVKLQIEIGEEIADFEMQIPGVGRYKTVHINAVILRNQPGGVPSASEAFVWNDLVNNVKPRYAQANINISINSVATADPPVGVDLSDGLALADSNYLPAEVKALVEGLGTLSNDDIHIFYVPFITTGVPGNPSQGAKGFALFDSAFPQPEDKPYTYNAFIGVNDADAITTAHELGHLLTNTGHPEAEGGLVEISPHLLKWQRNLMFGGAIVGRRIDDSIFDSKRLWRFQVDEMRNNPHAK